jgi:DNA-binding ferritin-like protein
MAVKSLFPEDMMSKGIGSELSLESIAAKLTYFELQTHLLHWQTTSYAQHKALGKLYEYVQDFKDGLIEKIMGYTGKRPSAYKIEALGGANASSVVSELMNFASQLKTYGEKNSFHDVCNLADSLSGETAKTKYLLTLT